MAFQKLPQDSAVRRFVAPEKTASEMDSDDFARGHREHRRAGVAAERRTIVRQRAFGLGYFDDFARSRVFGSKCVAEEHARESWIIDGVVEGIANRHHRIVYHGKVRRDRHWLPHSLRRIVPDF